ncbi:SidA/IucD/PvdA family monooxygenase [Mesorhizobium sp. M0814]
MHLHPEARKKHVCVVGAGQSGAEVRSSPRNDPKSRA